MLYDDYKTMCFVIVWYTTTI